MSERKLVLTDIDQTLLEGYIIFPFIKFQQRTGIIGTNTVRAVDRIANQYRRGGITYEVMATRLLMEYADGLKDTPVAKSEQDAAEFFNEGGVTFYPYAYDLAPHFKDTHDIYAVTGEPGHIAKIGAQRLGFNGYIASEFETESGFFTGRVLNPLATRQQKVDSLKALLQEYSLEDSHGFGDSEGDIEFLNRVQHKWCVNPTEGLREHAKINGWRVVSPDKIMTQLKNGF